MSKLKKLKPIVSELLKSNSLLKDNDMLLCARVWTKELRAMALDPDTMDLYSFMTILINSQISNPESITRVRRKLQQDNWSEYGGTKKVIREIEEVEHKQEIKTFNQSNNV